MNLSRLDAVATTPAPIPARTPAVPSAEPADGFAPAPEAEGGAYGPGLAQPPTTTAELAGRAKAAFDRVLAPDTPFEEVEKLWDGLVADTREWLARPESFGQDLDGTLRSVQAPGADVRIVHLQAPRPQLAGTMDRVWTFAQWKDPEGKVHMQPLHEDDLTSYREVRLVQEGDRQVLVALGRAKASTRDGALTVTVRELRDDRWEAPAAAFVSNAQEMEGHEVFLTPDGQLGIENDLAADDVLEASMPGDSPDVLFQGAEQHAMTWRDGHFELHIRTREEVLAEERQRQVEEWQQALAPHPDTIRAGADSVTIGGVTLPVRSLA